MQNLAEADKAFMDTSWYSKFSQANDVLGSVFR